jgi:hypothetical protein
MLEERRKKKYLENAIAECCFCPKHIMLQLPLTHAISQAHVLFSARWWKGKGKKCPTVKHLGNACCPLILPSLIAPSFFFR